MNWRRIKCAIFGHTWQIAPEFWIDGIAAERNCVCGAHVPAIDWAYAGHVPPRSIPEPRKP